MSFHCTICAFDFFIHSFCSVPERYSFCYSIFLSISPICSSGFHRWSSTDNSTDFFPSKSSSKAESTSASSASSEAESASSAKSTADGEVFDDTTVTVFAAKSLNSVMETLISEYNKTQPNVKLVGSYDSSGTLMTQIEEGASCDVFFSAAAKQMDQLEEENLLVEGTRHNIVNNQVCVVTYEGSNTEVTGLEDLNKASSIALADGSVPDWKIHKRSTGQCRHSGESRRRISHHNPAGFRSARRRGNQ